MGSGASGQGCPRGGAGGRPLGQVPVTRARRAPARARPPPRGAGAGSSLGVVPGVGVGGGLRSGLASAIPTGCWCSSRVVVAAGTTAPALPGRRCSTTTWTRPTTPRTLPGCWTWTTLRTRSVAGRCCWSPRARATSSPVTPSVPTGPAAARSPSTTAGTATPPPRSSGCSSGCRTPPGVRRRVQCRQCRVDPARAEDPPAVPGRAGGAARELPRVPVQRAHRAAVAVGGRPGAARLGAAGAGDPAGPLHHAAVLPGGRRPLPAGVVRPGQLRRRQRPAAVPRGRRGRPRRVPPGPAGQPGRHPRREPELPLLPARGLGPLRPAQPGLHSDQRRGAPPGLGGRPGQRRAGAHLPSGG